MVLLILLFMLFVPLAGKASDPGVAVKACQVMSKPFKDATPVASLQKGDAVEILQRKGGWWQISIKGKTGWVRMLDVRQGASGKKPSATKEASGVLDLASGRAGSGNVVAATGVRGLDEESLKQAEFNGQELQTLKSYRASGPDAQSFAKEAGLTSQQVPFLQVADGN